jgi:hypothetical protein
MKCVGTMLPKLLTSPIFVYLSPYVILDVSNLHQTNIFRSE